MRQVRVRKKPDPATREVELLQAITLLENEVAKLKEESRYFKDLLDHQLSSERKAIKNRVLGLPSPSDVAYTLLETFNRQRRGIAELDIDAVLYDIDKCQLRVDNLEIEVRESPQFTNLMYMDGRSENIRLPDRDTGYTVSMQVEIRVDGVGYA